MERLPFDSEGTYSGIEAAIHVARYTLAKSICKGKKVLDIACGEGYGARLLFDWGATEVVGVDVSAGSIESARKNFETAGIRYVCGDAQKADQLLAGEKFDLIISIETIEHLENPDKYLDAIANLRAPDGCILISCPNDWWYYPKINQRNEYHVSKYCYDNFIDLVTKSLGTPDFVGAGVPCVGFANLPINRVTLLRDSASQIEMMNAVVQEGSLILPAEPGSLSVKNVSYFLAAWGGGLSQFRGAAILPISMDSFSSGFWEAKISNKNREIEENELQLRLHSAEAKVEELSEQLEEQHLVTQKFKNQACALFCETTVLQKSLPEKDRIIEEMDIHLKEKNHIIEQMDIRLKEKDNTIEQMDIHLKALLKRWNIVTALPRKMVPAYFLLQIKKMARWPSNKV